MKKNTENMGKAAARWLQSEVDAGENDRVLVNADDIQYLLDYVKALEEPPVRVTKDVYLRGDWYYTILKLDLTPEQLELLEEIGKRTRNEGVNTVEVNDHNPEYPLPNWLGASRE